MFSFLSLASKLLKETICMNKSVQQSSITKMNTYSSVDNGSVIHAISNYYEFFYVFFLNVSVIFNINIHISYTNKVMTFCILLYIF